MQQAEQVSLEIAGRRVQLTGDTPEALADLVTALGAPCTPADAAEGLPALLLHAAPGTLTSPLRHSDRRVQHIASWSEDDCSIFAVSRTELAQVRAGRAVLDPGTAGVRGLHALLLPVLSELFADDSTCLAHAAAVEVDGAAVLVLAGSGQGKSTLVTGALGAGYGVLSDDLVVVRVNEGSVSVAGIPQPLALPADLAHESVVGTAIPDDPRDRHAPDGPSLLRSGWHPVKAVVLVGHSERDEGELRRPPGAQVLTRALSSVLEGLHPATAKRAFPLAAAVAKLPAWELAHARDPAQRLETVRAALATIRGARAPGA